MSKQSRNENNSICIGWNLMESEKREDESLSAQTDRRAFLEKAGKFAVGVSPAMIVLLSTSMSSSAIAQSTGGGGAQTTGGHVGPQHIATQRIDR
jgi:hypothetical protein